MFAGWNFGPSGAYDHYDQGIKWDMEGNMIHNDWR